MKRVALAAVFAALSLAAAAPALADEYDDAVAAQVSKFVSYPKIAATFDIEGRVGVKVDIDAQGRVTEVALEQPSLSHTLDQAALTAIRKVARTLAGPGEARTLHLTVNYKLI